MVDLKQVWAVGKRMGRRIREERGDVLMEYVLLNILIVLPLVGMSSALVQVPAPTFTGADVMDQSFGFLGDAFVNLYRMVMSGVCLPLP